MKKAWRPVASALLGLFCGLLVTLVAGENPWHVLEVLIKSAVGSRYDLGLTLFYSTPLVFTGISVALALEAGLFNIGAEGQLAVGAMAAASVGILFPHVPWPVAPAFALLAAAMAGAAWAGMAGWLRVRRGSHEVITTILLNFVAAALVAWLTLNPLRDPQSQNPETLSVGEGYRLSHFAFFEGAPLTSSVFLALLALLAYYGFRRRSVKGFEIRAVGASESAARTAGIDVGRARLHAMLLAGAMAGLVAAPEVLGSSGKFKYEFSPGYGFTGIAVAVLARGSAWGILAAALLFGALQKGSLDLDIETDKVTREISLVLQACVILFAAAEHLWVRRRRRT
ncbi:MAG: ABC transporter permease [Bdellovibrionales bacterium]|nr:ABC transporter permease [Bdellovibrionales bacterium]